MQIIERKAEPNEVYAEICHDRGRGTFQSRDTRDAVASWLKQAGYSVRRHTITNQQLHPEYVTDYVGRLEIGFGNTQYQTFWSKLYILEVSR